MSAEPYIVHALKKAYERIMALEQRVKKLEAAQKPRPAAEGEVVVVDTFGDTLKMRMTTGMLPEGTRIYFEARDDDSKVCLSFDTDQACQVHSWLSDMLIDTKPAGPEWPASLEEEQASCQCCGQRGPCDCAFVGTTYMMEDVNQYCEFHHKEVQHE